MRKSFTVDGVRYWVYGKTKAELNARYKEKLKAVQSQKTALSKQTVRAWSYEWLETYKEPFVNRNGYKDIKQIIDNWINPSIGKLPLTSVKPVQLQRIINSSTEHSQSYCDKIYQTIHQMFYLAYANDMIETDITKGLMKPKGRAPNARRALTEREREVCLLTADEHPFGLFVKVMYYCGLRPGEVAGLEWRDIDFEHETLSVNRAVKTGDILGEPKTKNGQRKVPIPTPLMETLKNLPRGEILVLSSTGRRYTKAMMTHMWGSFLTAMQGKDLENVGTDLTLYCLRHDYCTRLQDAGVPINIAKDLMGHSNISTTSKIYTHRSEESFLTAQKLINENVHRNV